MVPNRGRMLHAQAVLVVEPFAGDREDEFVSGFAGEPDVS